MAKKTQLRHYRPSVLWRETNRAKQHTQMPLNSPRLAKSKESKQTEQNAQAQSQRTNTRPWQV
ncbi:MAG: hypothetical protein ABI234_11355 [Ktedonobacteraceae bacterium]